MGIVGLQEMPGQFCPEGRRLNQILSLLAIIFNVFVSSLGILFGTLYWGEGFLLFHSFSSNFHSTRRNRFQFTFFHSCTSFRSTRGSHFLQRIISKWPSWLLSFLLFFLRLLCINNSIETLLERLIIFFDIFLTTLQRTYNSFSNLQMLSSSINQYSDQQRLLESIKFLVMID